MNTHYKSAVDSPKNSINNIPKYEAPGSKQQKLIEKYL